MLLVDLSSLKLEASGAIASSKLHNLCMQANLRPEIHSSGWAHLGSTITVIRRPTDCRLLSATVDLGLKCAPYCCGLSDGSAALIGSESLPVCHRTASATALALLQPIVTC